jgi:hypothetical protein
MPMYGEVRARPRRVASDGVPGGGMSRACRIAMVATRKFLATLMSMLLVALWAALAVGVVLTVVFPERSISVSGTTASSR